MTAMSIEQLTAFATPNPLPVHLSEHLEQRNWVVRLAVDSAEAWCLDEAASLLTATATAAVRAARDARGLATAGSTYTPVVRLIRIDRRHVVVSIMTAKLEDHDAHAYLVAASAALSALDELSAIDDIQGLPRRFWTSLVGPR